MLLFHEGMLYPGHVAQLAILDKVIFGSPGK